MRNGLIAVLALSVVACTSQPKATGSAAATLQLRVAPADLGCDAMGMAYKSATFEIDPNAADPVTAVTDTGTTLQTFWSAGFEGGTAAEPVVRDPDGQVVATDGETLTIPDGDWPRLKGYFVCPSTDALYVLLQDPT